MIKIEGISKKFKLYHSPADRLKEIVTGKKYHKDFVALDNISFEIGPGETLGIIGQNGAGKSTLLKILSGIVIPDSGTIRIDGKVTGLLELGTGFNFEMTGLENIYMNGLLIGMTRDEIDRKKQTIIDFSELGGFINESIKTYSSGMVMRLAFSIAIHADPTCFLVDEALSVGDAYFQQKCIRKIKEFRASGGSIVFVSHDMNAIRVLCDAALLLNEGKMIDYGYPKSVVDFYQSMILKKMHQGDIEVNIKSTEGNSHSPSATFKQYGISTEQIVLHSIIIVNKEYQEVNNIESGELINIICKFRSNTFLKDPHYGLFIREKNGSEVYGTSTECQKIVTHPQNIDEIITMICSVTLPLAPGNYTISLGVANGSQPLGLFDEYCLFVHDTAVIKVLQNPRLPRFAGIINLDAKLEIIKNNQG